MINNYNERVNFGQYRGLSIKDIYQGTLNLNRIFLVEYLNQILNSKKNDSFGINEINFIEKFEIDEFRMHVIGEIHNEDNPMSENNRIVFGNIQDSLSAFINLHFNNNFLGILLDIKSFNKTQVTL